MMFVDKVILINVILTRTQRTQVLPYINRYKTTSEIEK